MCLDLPESKPCQGLPIDKSEFVRTLRFMLFFTCESEMILYSPASYFCA